MTTSQTRVGPAPPQFIEASIQGGVAGFPLYAQSVYHGGVAGRCKYEWSISNETDPLIVPTMSDVGRKVSCRMTPIRMDGSIGPTVIVKTPEPLLAPRIDRAQ
jgi:hypothetical protein